MSEHAPHTGERHIATAEQSHQQAHEHLQELEQRAEQAQRRVGEQAAEARQKIEQQAISGKEYSPAGRETGHNQPDSFWQATELRLHNFNQTMRRVRHRLTPVQRRFSKVIHRPVVERLSDIGGKTVARPSGIFGGAVFALLGTTTILFVAKHIGAPIPQSIYPIFFVGGFLFGVLIELVFKFFKRAKASR